MGDPVGSNVHMRSLYKWEYKDQSQRKDVKTEAEVTVMQEQSRECEQPQKLEG